MARFSATACLLAILTFATQTVTCADASANYTEQLLSSGTIKLGDWQEAYDKASAFVDALTPSEQLTLVTGGDVGNFSALVALDSATNPLKYFYVTTWPAGLAIAMTWSPAGAHAQGAGVGAEFKAKGVHLAYGPTLAPLGRSAWCGRTGETYGVDSYHAGRMAAQVVQGMASVGLTATTKHFIMNEQETLREASSAEDSYSVTIGDKAFHETYVAPFYDTVKAGMGGAMCAMNRVNGTHACESQDVLAKTLKVELGFPGLVSADVGAQLTGVNAANAGMDLSSSQYWSNDTLLAALANGTFTAARLRDMAVRNLMAYYRHGQDGEGDGTAWPAHVGYEAHVDVRGNHSVLARQLAGDSIALLKNVQSSTTGLPLRNRTSISIFGYHAAPRYVGANTALSVYDGEPATMQGHMTTVGGSAMGSLAYVTTPIQKFVERAATDGFMLRWWLTDEVVNSSSSVGGGAMSTDNELNENTAGVAQYSDACVVFANAWGGEGGDRTELRNDAQDALVRAVAAVCNNTIVVVNTVGPRVLDAWIDHVNVTGVLYAGPLGQESGNALDDVLFGRVNPSGRLVHTIARDERDYDPSTRIDNATLALDYTDGNYIDYKYFDAHNITPRYEFGYGLSYTTFAYAPTVNVTVTVNATTTTTSDGAAAPLAGLATGARAVGGREDLWDTIATVTTSVTNTGAVAGAEVAQLYVSFPAAADEPVRQLRGFQKTTSLAPGARADLAFPLRRRDLSVWDVAAHEWRVVAGVYTFWVGASSRDLKASTTLTIS